MLSPSQIQPQPGILPALPARHFRDQSCTSRREILQLRTDRREEKDEKCSETSEGNHFTQSHTHTSLPAPASPGYHEPQEKHHSLNFKLAPNKYFREHTNTRAALHQSDANWRSSIRSDEHAPSYMLAEQGSIPQNLIP